MKCGGSMKTNFQGLGWEVRLQKRKTNYSLTLVKEIVLGNGLKKGDLLPYYLVTCDNRKAVLVFLDGKERPKEDFIQLKGISFLMKK